MASTSIQPSRVVSGYQKSKGRVSPKGTWPPRAGDRIKHTSLVLYPGIFPLVVLNIFPGFCVLGQDFGVFECV